jgi:hypothetical protein
MMFHAVVDITSFGRHSGLKLEMRMGLGLLGLGMSECRSPPSPDCTYTLPDHTPNSVPHSTAPTVELKQFRAYCVTDSLQ